MTESTAAVLIAILKADSSITPQNRSEVLALLRNGSTTRTTEAKLLRRAQAADKLGVSLNTLDRLCRTGALTKRKFPNRKRSAGISQAEVDAFITGRA